MGLAEHERDRASAAWVIIGAESPYSAEADHRFRPDDRRFRAMPIVALERSVARCSRSVFRVRGAVRGGSRTGVRRCPAWRAAPRRPGPCRRGAVHGADRRWARISNRTLLLRHDIGEVTNGLAREVWIVNRLLKVRDHPIGQPGNERSGEHLIAAVARRSRVRRRGWGCSVAVVSAPSPSGRARRSAM